MKRNIIDLFAGCGGMSTGFEMSNFKTVFALEKDLWASETYKANHKKTVVTNIDISNFSDFSIFKDKEIDGVVGGPPCQGFSLSGKRDPNDPRNSLFVEFVRFVRNIQPKFFVMENVPGLLSMKTQNKENVVDIIVSEFNKINYNVTYFKLNAAEFGVPQNRIRVFFIGLRKEIEFNEDLLKPKGFLFGDKQLSIKDAISDLPYIESGEGQEEYSYSKEANNEYQKWIRKSSDNIKNHISMKHTERIIERFKTIEQGSSLKDVSREHMQRKRGNADVISGKTFSQNNMRPFWDKPSPTVAASFQGNFIHPLLNRNYTAREAARLQSFPDWYVFMGKRTTMSWETNLSQYQQIGNAVPPLLAKAIAQHIDMYLKRINI